MNTEVDTQPWYRQFWLWFVLTPLILVVCVSMVTVTIAFRHADDVVIDNYYKQGRAINQTLAQDHKALALGLSAQLRFDQMTGEVFLNIASQEPLAEELLLLMGHPFEADMDQQVLLKKVTGNQYRGELKIRPEYSWYLSLLPETDLNKRKEAEWILSGKINFELGDNTELKPRVDADH